MIRTFVGASLIVFTSFGAFGQSAAGPSFEAASVKPAPPPTTANMIRVGMKGGPGTPDPGRINYANVSLKDMIRQAYGLKDYQISGPDWLSSTRFDVVATLPPDSTKEQFQLMLQNLLADRFKMTVHREKRELPIYALVVGKNGPKLKESVDDPATGADGKVTVPMGGPSASGGPGGGPGGGRTGGGGGGGEVMFSMAVGGGGGGAAPAGAPRNGMMMMSGKGLQAKKMTITGLADLLARQLDRPVLDMTELKGNYDFNLDYAPDDSMHGMKGMPMPMPRTEGGGEGRGPADGASENTSATLFSALQTQLGLKLEPRKAPLDFVVVDHAEKVPTEN